MTRRILTALALLLTLAACAPRTDTPETVTPPQTAPETPAPPQLTDPAARAKLGKSVLGFLPIVAYAAGAVAVWAGSPSGLYLVAAGCLLAIITGILVSWVALVEVLR